jgi:hypothetical protein
MEVGRRMDAAEMEIEMEPWGIACGFLWPAWLGYQYIYMFDSGGG